MSTIRVVVADDHQQMLLHVCEFLSAHSCEVVAAVSDGQAAVDAAARLLPDVVVLDVSMPILNGLEAARQILAANPSAKIVFLTVDRDPDTRRAAFEAGVLGFVLKPRLAADLIPAIRLVHNGHGFASA